MANKEFDISEATYYDVKNVQYDYAVLPWGATEPHNYHLPYLTDCYLAHDISVDAVVKAYEKEKIRGMVLPPIPLGSQNPGQRDLSFCLHARYETQKAILNDIVASLDFQGIHILIIINAHGGNNFTNMIRDLAIDYPDFTIVVSNWYAILPQSEYFEEKDDHAGELETSVLMHYRPQLVNLVVAGDGAHKSFKSQMLRDGLAWTPRNWNKISKDTGTGNPKKSTAEKGKKYAEDASDKLVELFAELVNGNIY